MGYWKNRIPAPIYNFLQSMRYRSTGERYYSYSQEGEDMILRRIFESLNSGFYIDIGAYHPKRFSNTYFFYKKGWKGINIDALPATIDLFNSMRKSDTNICVGISKEVSELTYYQFEDSALNTFSPELAEVRMNDKKFGFKNSITVKTKPLSMVLDECKVPDNIDFMSIDVEGLELEVLKSNNWEKYRPGIILLEELDKKITDFNNFQTLKFLEPLGYSLFAKTYNTIFYIDNNFRNSFIRK